MERIQLSTRIQAPACPTPILHRSALIDLLAQTIGRNDTYQRPLYKLILLCAPAGYGKTTLLADTMRRCPVPCCWYFLRKADTPAIFLHALLASIRNCFPLFANHLDSLLSDVEEVIDDGSTSQDKWITCLDALIDTLKSEISQRFIITLCNYQEVEQNGKVNDLVNHFLAHLPPEAIMIIESRALPNLELASLIARRQMFGLGSNRFSFSPQELYQLAELQGLSTFSLQDAEHISNAFEGWITGILLGSGLGYTLMYPLAPSQAKAPGTPALLADHRQLSNYMVKEIFKHEMAAYEFLEAVSILDRLTPEYCNTLLKITNAAERLIYAEQHGLFVVRSADTGMQEPADVYKCHPILRELMMENLRNRSLDRFRELHRLAALIMQNEKKHEDALQHALQAQDYSLTANIITQNAPSLIAQGDDGTVDRWLALLPKDILRQDPHLLLIQVNLYLSRNEYTRAAHLLDEADALLEARTAEQGQPEQIILQADIMLARSKLLFYQGQFYKAQELCQQALNLLPADETRLRVKVYQRLGVCLIVGSGQLQAGIVQLQQALHLGGSQKEEPQMAMLHRQLASAYGWLGMYTLADYHQTRALRIWEKLGRPRGIVNSLTSMGLLKLRQGFLQEAEEVLTKALVLARESYHFKSGEAYALVAIGELHCDQGQYVHALTHLEDGLALAHQCEDYYLVHCALCSLAKVYLLMGEFQTSQFFLDQVTLSPQEAHGFDGLLYCLTQGMLSLSRQAYDQACQELEQAVTLGQRISVQFLHIQALLLLAVCYHRQQRMSKAWQTSEKAIELNKKGDFDYTLKSEMLRYPELQTLLNQDSHADYFRQEKPTSTIEPSSQTHEFSPFTSLQFIEYEQTKTDKLFITAFGEPRLLVNGIHITRWHMTRSLELFFLLLQYSSPVHKDKMIDALWPHTTNEQIETTARTAIYYLRKAIGKACIVHRSGLYSLNLSAVYSEYSYDVALFEQHYNKAKKALSAQDNVTANTEFSCVVELYKGDYVQPFYNDWCIGYRDRLRLIYIDALQQLATIAWRGENWEASLQHWQHILSLDACYEKAHYGVMCCYLKQGKRELALRQYKRCCQSLKEELQTVPGPLIQKLYNTYL